MIIVKMPSGYNSPPLFFISICNLGTISRLLHTHYAYLPFIYNIIYKILAVLPDFARVTIDRSSFVVILQNNIYQMKKK